MKFPLENPKKQVNWDPEEQGGLHILCSLVFGYLSFVKSHINKQVVLMCLRLGDFFFFLCTESVG